MKYTANTLENHWMPFTSNRDFKADGNWDYVVTDFNDLAAKLGC